MLENDMLKSMSMMDTKNPPPGWEMLCSTMCVELWPETVKIENEPFFYLAGRLLGLWFCCDDLADWANAIPQTIPDNLIPWFHSSVEAAQLFAQDSTFNNFLKQVAEENVPLHAAVVKMLSVDFYDGLKIDKNAPWNALTHSSAVIFVSFFSLALWISAKDKARALSVALKRK